MEFLFYMVACVGIVVLGIPLYSIAQDVSKIAAENKE